VFYPKIVETDEKAKDEFNQALSAKLTEMSGKGPDGFNAFTWFYEQLEKTGSKTIQAKASGAERKLRKKQRAADNKKADATLKERPSETGEREADDA
jgi:hypothetical protein